MKGKILKLAPAIVCILALMLVAVISGKNVLANRYFVNAVEDQEHGDLNKAKSGYNRSLLLNPLHSEAAFQLGVCYQKEDQTKKAEALMLKADRLDKDNVDFKLGLGYLYYNYKKDTKMAKKYFEAAYRLNKTSYNAPFMLALLAEKDNEKNKAISYYEKTIELNPKLIIAYSKLAALYKDCGQCDKEMQIKAQCEKITNKNSEIMCNQGKSCPIEQVVKEDTK